MRVFHRGSTDPLADIRRTEEYQDRVARLGRYNSEVGRGVMHTPEWVAFMADEQAWFNDLHYRRVR